MKLLFTTLAFFLTVNAYATEKNNSIELTLSQEERKHFFRLQDDEYKDIYENRMVDEYCEKRVLNGNCSYNAQTGMTCRAGGSFCTTDPTWEYDNCYETLRYACQVERSVFIRSEFVKTHIHNIDLKLDENLKLGNAKLNLAVASKHAAVSVNLANSYPKDLIHYVIDKSGEKTTIIIKPLMSEALAEQFKNLSVENLSFDKGEINLLIKNGAVLKDFIKLSSIQIDQDRLFGDKIIYSTPYRKPEKGGKYDVQENDLNVKFNCQNSNIPCLNKGKYNVYIKVGILLNDKVLNAKDFSYLNKDIKGQIYKVRL